MKENSPAESVPTSSWQGGNKPQRNNGQEMAWQRVVASLLTLVVASLVMLPSGFAACYFFFPRTMEKEKIVFKEKVVTVVPKEKDPHEEWLRQQEIEKEAKKLAGAMAIQLIKKSWAGVFDIDDDEAQQIRWSGAAVVQRDIFAQKDVFRNLLHGPPYDVHTYSIYKNKGYGITEGYLKADKNDPGQHAFFLSIWNSKKNKVPAKNPGSFNSPNGTTIALGR